MSGSTAALVALEDLAPDAMFATLPGSGIPLWPLLRWPLSEALAHTQYETSLPPRREGPLGKIGRFARTALPSRVWSRALRRHYPVLFLGTGSRNTPTPAGSFNPLLGPFAELLGERSAMLQNEPIPFGRRFAFEPTATFEDAVVASELRARFRPPRTSVLRAADEMAEELFRLVEHPVAPELRARAMRTFRIRVARAVSLAESYARLLDRVRPRLLILQQAAYGDRSTLVSAAHERGIRVAEPQHGWIGGAHGAYHFGAAARDPRLRRTIPDDLLTFGRYWSESVSGPFETVEVGKPGLEDAAAAAPPLDRRPEEVVVASTVVDPEEVARFVLRLREVLPAGWTVRFRPHPKERQTVAERYPSLAGAPRIEFDMEPDPYVSFGRARILVSANSTSLYEAIALRTPIVVRVSSMSGDYSDPEIFPNQVQPGGDPEPAIRRAIETPERDQPPELVERVWATGSRERFRRYVEENIA
ncbi:MAG: hypothetical protein KF727_02635 [Microbacteriaceae bacterium]|nr:hypothetical protein [Microbacteriaceae bacterium]